MGKASKKSELMSCANNAEDLKKYLREKGKSHNNYKYYAEFERIEKIREKKKLYLTADSEWNDNQDKLVADDSYKLFARCLSFSRDESIAMWMLYGGIECQAGMIDFTKKGINSICNATSVSVGRFVDENFVLEKKLEKGEFEIYLTDILYFKENKQNFFVNRADEVCYKMPKSVFKELKGLSKTYHWKYENECRLMVKVNISPIIEKCNAVEIDLEGLDMGISFERIYTGPLHKKPGSNGCKKSLLTGKVNWSLYDKDKYELYDKTKYKLYDKTKYKLYDKTKYKLVKKKKSKNSD